MIILFCQRNEKWIGSAQIKMEGLVKEMLRLVLLSMLLTLNVNADSSSNFLFSGSGHSSSLLKCKLPLKYSIYRENCLLKRGKRGKKGNTGPTGPTGPTGATGGSGSSFEVYASYNSVEVQTVAAGANALFENEIVLSAQGISYNDTTGVFTIDAPGTYAFSFGLFSAQVFSLFVGGEENYPIYFYAQYGTYIVKVEESSTEVYLRNTSGGEAMITRATAGTASAFISIYQIGS